MIGFTPLPPEWLVKEEVSSEIELKPFISTGEAVYSLLKGIKTYQLKQGDYKMGAEPLIYHNPKRPTHKLIEVGQDRVRRIKAIINDLKAEGIDRLIPPGANKETALLNFATLQDYKQQLAQLLTGMSPSKRDGTLADIKVWPALLKRLDTDISHDYGLLPIVSKEDELVLQRYFDGGRDLCQIVGAIQQLEKITIKSGMPLLPDSELDRVNPWLKAELYTPTPSKTQKSLPIQSWRANPGRSR